MALLRIAIFAVVFWLLGQVLRRTMASKGRGRYGQGRPGPQPGDQNEPNANGAGPGSSHGPPSAKSPYEVLEVPPNASVEEMRAAYRRKVQQYHPDKVAGMGPEIREVAERRMKEINAAYEELKRRHGL